MGLGDMEERGDGDLATAIAEASRILAVGFCRVIIRIEAAETVIDGAAILAQLSHQSESDGQPIGIVWRNVDARGLDGLGEGFDGFGGGWFFQLFPWSRWSPFIRVENGLFHRKQGLRNASGS